MADLHPSFLICSERSGSNLIRSILNAHPKVYAPQPIHLGAFWERSAEFGDLQEDARWRALLGAIVEFHGSWKGSLGPGLEFSVEGLMAAIPRRSFAAIYGHFYGRGLAASGKAQLFIKENHTAQRAELFEGAYPDAKFVFQVRDPHDFVASCKRMSAYKYGSAEGALAVWCADQRAALSLRERLPPERLFSLRYEDLLDAPRDTLGSVCAFMGLGYAPEMLAFHETEDAKRSASHAAWRNLSQPIIQGNSGRYAEILDADEIALVADRAGGLMGRLGYAEPTQSSPEREGSGLSAGLSAGAAEQQPHQRRLDDGSSSAAVQRVIDRYVGRG